ncbi:MAG TPA: ATP-binding cassette domain-containing protein [Steroidobacteraceae bacterium]|jgi:ABC-type multidrug transport system ATPase subunit/peptidoglycan/LPS O-acetylase OafA/YrhL|nr:ATP-binding cassette domain-containing protein [Steroidobacteraceae bacterium]
MNTPDTQRLHALDAVRGFALLLGVAFHATMSFLPGLPPGIWSMVDNSPSQSLSDAGFVAHIFRMSLFFFIAGFFGRMLFHKLGARGFWTNRLLRIGVPLIVGWVVLWPLIMAIWGAGMNKFFGGHIPAMPPMPKVAGAFPLAHLWFLYQLLLLYVAVTVVRSFIVPFDRANRLRCLVDAMVVSSLRFPVAVFTLGVPVALALIAQPMWFYWMSIPTPDSSLIPQVPATVGFGTAFAFGWLVNRANGALPAIERAWPTNLLLAVVSTAGLMYIMHATPMAQPGLEKIFYALQLGVAIWGWVLGLTGAALRFLSNYSATRRYIADASYWIYLAHLPVVAGLAVWVGQWPVSWMLKYPFILVVSFAALFASYHLLVRHSFVGQLLNGRKYPWRKPAIAASTTLPAPAVATTASLTNHPVAEMRGIVKKYGKTIALAGIDVEVRPGELLAVLGPNGAGKSTAISLWLGLIEADAGEVKLLGGSPQDLAQRRGLGVMMQDVELPKELKVRELIALSASYYDDPMSVEEALKRAGIEALADRRYGKLSGGQKRQTQFAMAICGRPRVLFLDEPTVGLDVKMREAVWASVKRLLADGCSIVLTTHYLEEAEALADRITVITKGRVIASGSVDDMRAMVARRQISCETTLAAEEVRAWPGVVDAQRSHDRLQITATDAEGVVRRLLAADAALLRLEVRQAGLNEAFNELTKEAA